MAFSRILRILLKIFAALLIGIVITFFLIQRDERFIQIVNRGVKQFFRANYLGELEGQIVELNLLSPTLTMEHMVVRPLATAADQTNWGWRARRGTLSFSWFNFLLTRKLAIHIILHEYDATSAVDNAHIAIGQHLQKLFEPPAVPVPAFLKELLIRKGTFRFIHQPTNSSLITHLHCDMKKIGPIAKVSFYPIDGQLTVANTIFMQALEGSISLDVQPLPQGPRIKAVSALRFDLPHLSKKEILPFMVSLSNRRSSLLLNHMNASSQQTCFLEGSWLYNQGHFSLYNHDRSLQIEPIEIDEKRQASCTVRAPIRFLAELLTAINSIYKGTHEEDDSSFAGMEGSCVAHMMADLSALYGNFHGDIVLNNLRYKFVSVDGVKLDFASQEKKLMGSIAITQSTQLGLAGSWSWDMQHGGVFSLANATPISFPALGYWYSKPNNCMVTAQVTDAGDCTAQFDTTISHRILDTTLVSSGSLSKQGQQLEVTGTAGDKHYLVRAALEPTFQLKEARYQENDTILATCSSNESQEVSGTIDYHLIRSWLPDSLRSELAGQGTILFQGQRTTSGIEGKISLADGTIKVPQLYNFINNFHATLLWNGEQKKVTISDLQCGLYRGRIYGKQTTIYLDDAYNLSFMHVPVTLDSCFISWQKDLFTNLSGSLLFTYQPDSSSLEGVLFADRAHLKGNLLSSDMQRSLLLSSAGGPSKFSDLDLNLMVLTKSPLQVKTSFLDAQAKFDLSIKKSLSTPEVAGEIKILGGDLKFPYRPLHITSGSIVLMPQQLFDPMIELTAKNVVKKHTVNLFVSGSVQNPQLRFEASPTLTEEQIISLLLSGAEGSSLPMAMPTFLVQNLQQIMFGPAQSSSMLNGYFSSLLQPFSRVRLVPRFSDEGGRGGLRGAIEIEVNDRFTGLIEKNFSLTEDTRFEANHLLSDDINLRGIKDEHGDLGGEMEVRWKF